MILLYFSEIHIPIWFLTRIKIPFTNKPISVVILLNSGNTHSPSWMQSVTVSVIMFVSATCNQKYLWQTGLITSLLWTTPAVQGRKPKGYIWIQKESVLKLQLVKLSQEV